LTKVIATHAHSQVLDATYSEGSLELHLKVSNKTIEILV